MTPIAASSYRLIIIIFHSFIPLIQLYYSTNSIKPYRHIYTMAKSKDDDMGEDKTVG